MDFTRRLLNQTLLLLSLLVVVGLVSGCGVDQSPVAVSDEGAEPAAKKKQPPGQEKGSSTADLSAEEARSVSEWVKPRGKTQLHIEDLNAFSSADDNLYVNLVVPSRAVSKRVQVTMTVYGNYLSDLVIVFQPGGLVFDQDAELEVGMSAGLVDIDTETLQVWHEYEDGTVEKTTVTATKTYQDGYFEFKAVVSGFSRYGLRGS